MALSFEYLSAAGAVTDAGVFIPVADLPGVDAAELDAAEVEAAKESKCVLAVLNALQTYLATDTDVLGVSCTRGNPSTNAADILTLNFTAQWQKLVNLGSNTVGVIPAATTGANADLAAMAIVDVFPTAAYVAAGANTPGAGVVVSHAAMAAYGLTTVPTVAAGDDDRAWFVALLEMMTAATVRDTANTIESAITVANPGAMGAQAIPASYYADTDPLTDIAAADISQRGIVTRSFAFSVQVELNQATQSFDVRVA
ncbi:MAG: hypothetical protein AAF827_03870 [Cyanobacteria bacterium P01_D01_bin.6]